MGEGVGGRVSEPMTLFPALPEPGRMFYCGHCHALNRRSDDEVADYRRTHDQFALRRFCEPCRIELNEMFREVEIGRSGQRLLF